MKNGWLLGLGAVAGAAVGAAAITQKRRGDAEKAERLRRLQASPGPRGKNIVILGAGFGGITTASTLLQHLPPESGWTITLVDRRNYFLFTPLLYHAATGLVEPSSILFPVRSLAQAGHFVFRESAVLGIDLHNQTVRLDDGELAYDHLVLSLGSVPNYFGKEEQLRHALTLKNTGDALALRNRIIDAFEAAELLPEGDERRRCLTFVVVGGGATGVELVGAMNGLVEGTLARHYPRIRRDEVRLVLLEALPEILPNLPRELAGYSAQRLRELGVEVRTETPVEWVDADGMLTTGGEYIPSRTVVWTAGVQPEPVSGGLDLPRLKNGRILVDPFLQVRDNPGVYAIGDAAAYEDPNTGKPLPPNAAVAVQQARSLAAGIMARLEGRAPEPFQYVRRGELVSLGRHEAAAEVGGVHVTGLPAWLLWRGFYLSQLMGFRNQLAVALDWTFAYFYQRETARLDGASMPAPVTGPQPGDGGMTPGVDHPAAGPSEAAGSVMPVPST